LSFNARKRLLDTYLSAQTVYDGFLPDMLTVTGSKAYAELAELRERGLDKIELSLTRGGISLTALGDEDFPALLEEITDPPDLLFYKGSMRKHEERAISIIGSRRETGYGREQAFRIARDLAANGITVVSGLARGIDTAAHEGALDGGGRTIAILGSGIKRVYPPENMDLAERMIAQGGAVISEFHPNAGPLAFHFPFRNRLVSGLSHGVLLIEAREKSGTQITIGHALAQGREIFALPGQVGAPGSEVPHRMIREGARLVTSAADILDDMGWQYGKSAEQMEMPMPDLTNQQRRLYDALCDEPKGFDELSRFLEISVPQLNVALTQLELSGLIETLPGRMFRQAGR
jgi:DNA processing protein